MHDTIRDLLYGVNKYHIKSIHMQLVIDNRGIKHHVSQDVVIEFENTIIGDRRISISSNKNKFISKINHALWKKLYKLNISSANFVRYLPWNILNPFKRTNCFVILMGIDFRKCLSVFLNAKQKNIYMFDAWPNHHQLIDVFINNFQIDNVFLSSSEATLRLSQRNTRCNFYWIPEAINPDEYKHSPYHQKTIDVIQLGRKHEVYHQIIQKPLLLNSKVYLFEKTKGEIIFPDKKDFIKGLANSKISICFPSNVTHPERSGCVETMTARYLQSMISKCLVVGHAPKEMIELFGYNPVIEIDNHDPAKQLLVLLSNYENHIPLIEKNYKVIIRNHTWSHRWSQISKILFPAD